MRNLKIRRFLGAAACLAIVAIAAFGFAGQLIASDHYEAPAVQADPSMDVTDLYLFEGAAGKTVAVIDFAGLGFSLTQPTTVGTYNANALYTLHIDNTGDNEEDIAVLVRFGQNGAGEWGVQVENLPGSAVIVQGPVENIIDDGDGNKVYAGRRDDPFFFDAQGYLDTLATGTLSITNDRDFLEGLNCTSIVLEFDTASALDGGSELACWATSARL